MQFKLGKKKATYSERSLGTALALSRHLDLLGLPPPSSNYYAGVVEKLTNGDWGMMGNDVVGDCVIADDAHYMMLRTANTGTMITPTTQQTIDQYSAVTGYNPNDPNTDQGTNESDDDTYLIQHGFLGHKCDVQGRLDPGNMNHIKWCVQLFGHVRLGIVVTQAFMDQFDAGQVLSTHWVDQKAILGGHDVPIVHYDPNYLYVVTWGKMVRMTYRCYNAICTNVVRYGEGEAHVELFSDWITSQGVSPSGLSLATLEADLKSVIYG